MQEDYSDEQSVNDTTKETAAHDPPTKRLSAFTPCKPKTGTAQKLEKG
jgi:hypothetical protein